MLNNLHIENFRCFENFTVSSLGQINLIVGRNNSGKSTLLEAVYLYANRGNVQAIVSILTSRNELANNPSSIEFDDLKNIFKADYKIDLIINDLNIHYVDNIRKKYNISSKFLPEESGLQVSFKNEKLQIASSQFEDYLKGNYKQIPRINNSFVDTNILYENDMALLWDKAQDDGFDEKIENILRIIEPRLVKLYFTMNVFDSTNPNRIAKVKLKKPQQIHTLKSLGEGIGRLLQIILQANQAKDGYLMIDEFENGLHYSIQEEIWTWIFKLAKELNIQVFVTTHSEDTVKTFSKVAIANKKVEGKLLTLGRSIAKSNKGQITAHVYDKKRLDWITNSGMEIR